MRILAIQNCRVEGFGQYEQVLHDLRVDCRLVHAYRDEPLPYFKEFDAILIGGTPISAYEAHDHPFLLAERRYLEEAVHADRACFGICCGAQILAQILGAEVRRCERMEIGVYEVRLTEAGRDDALLEGLPSRFPVFRWHGDTFDIPEGADLLVEGQDCRNQMFRKGKVVGVQFHLETSSSEAQAWADGYGDELVAFGKSRAEVVAECRDREQEMQVLAERLLGNFLEIAACS
jgi:GMP synthase-like glutamine amidotransferase